ncbi:MAG: beta strand repeat-containing protein [Planctomycetaceae bacterium]
MAVSLMLPAASFGQIQLTEVTRYNLVTTLSTTTSIGDPNPIYIGNNVSAVAWSGSRLFVGGFNNSGVSSSAGIIEVLNTNTTGIVVSTAVQYGPLFGSFGLDPQLGYSGLAFDGSRVFGALNVGYSDYNGLSGYDVAVPSSPASLWNAQGRGSAGVAMDPGYVVGGASQGGSGVGWGTFGDGNGGSSNRRGLNDPASGAVIYGFDPNAPEPLGFQWNTADGTVFPRDITFDPDSGDLYGRANNAVIKAVRTGANSAGTPATLATGLSVGNAVGQNIAFMNNTTAGDLLVFNNRPSGASQQFAQAVRITDTSGVAQPVTWSFLGGASGTNGGFIDFSFDQASQTLAVTDASNSRVSIFRFGAPGPATRLTWAADGANFGGTGTWNTSGTSWIGDYGAQAWESSAQAVFTGTTSPTSAVTVAPGGVSVGRGMSFVTAGYTVGGGAITLTGSTASTTNLYVEPGVSATVNSAIASANGLSKSGAGTLVVGGTISGGNVFVNNGTLQLASTGRVQPNALAGVSIGATGTFDVSAVPGGYAVPAGTGLAGAGTVQGAVTVASNGVVSPGSNLGTLTVTGATTLGAGGNSNWQITDAAGAAGTGWDLLSVGGPLSITATSGDPFKVNLWSLSSTGPDVNGNALNFNSATSGTWRIASAAGGITGFAANKFAINVSATNGTAGFSNPTSGGTFSVAQSGNDLNLVFTAGAAPDPTTLTWYGDGVNPGGGGTWTTTGTTWFDGTTVRSWVPGAKAIFSGTGGTVTLKPLPTSTPLDVPPSTRPAPVSV